MDYYTQTEGYGELELMSLENKVELPYVLKDRRLIGPGRHNNMQYEPLVLKKMFTNTKWNNQTRALFYDHYDMAKGGGARTWVGEIKNEHVGTDGAIYGDIVILDKQAAINLEYGAKFGISAKVRGTSDKRNMVLLDGEFDNWSLVFVPADKTTFLNFEEIKMAEIEEKQELEEKKPLVTETVVEAKTVLAAEVKPEFVSLGDFKAFQEKILGEFGVLKETLAKCVTPPGDYPAPSAAPIDKAKKYPYPNEMSEKPKEVPMVELAKEVVAPVAPTPIVQVLAPVQDILSKDELMGILENSAYGDFMKKFLKENPGKTIADAAAAWKTQSQAKTLEKEMVDEKAVAELKAKVEALELKLTPERTIAKVEDANTSVSDLIATLSDEEVDKAFVKYHVLPGMKRANIGE